MSVLWLNRKYILKNSVQYTTYILSLIGFIGLFAPINEIFPMQWNLLVKILASATCCLVVWLFVSVVISHKLKNKERIEIFEAENNCHVYVQYGDVFSDEVLGTEERKRNIVIPVNRCFDTIIDNDLIAVKSLHGEAFNKIYETGIYTQETLDETIQNNLKLQRIMPEIIMNDDKRAGNLKRYPVGSVAEIYISDECTYFLLGLTTFNYNLKAQTSMEEYVLAMMKLIRYCYERSQMYPIIIPLVGAGLARTNKSERVILEYIVKLLKLNRELIKSDIYIVVRDSGKESIAITDL